MNDRSFRQLMASIREGGDILRGRARPSRQFTVEASDVNSIRKRTRLSQAEFAGMIGVSVRTLQNWEQARRRPTGPAAVLLKIIASEPATAVRAIHR